ncbi:MAG: peptidoglycan-binding domain-containing protein [Terriglobales bacterium]
MNRWWLNGALLVLCAGFAFAQTESNPAAGAQSNPPAATQEHPEGTVVKKREREAIVAPKKAPVKVTPGVIKSAQKELADQGFDPGSADGRMGPKTRKAIREFQAKNDLPQTGNLDQPTLAKLNVGATQQLSSAPRDLGRGGKAFGHNIKEGHPVEAGKGVAKGAGSFGKKVGSGVKSGAMGIKDKIGSGMSKVGEKVEGDEQPKEEQPKEKKRNPPE